MSKEHCDECKVDWLAEWGCDRCYRTRKDLHAMLEADSLLKPFGLEVSSYGPDLGASFDFNHPDVAGVIGESRFRLANFSKDAWTWLKPLLRELIQHRANKAKDGNDSTG